MNWFLNTFTWPIAGGMMVGLAAALLMLFNGRVAGISGVYASALNFPEGDSAWRWSMLGGLVVGGFVLLWTMGPVALENTLNTPILVVALGGLLVGIGSRLGSGCTSGHGICGLARFSPRSLVSVITFLSSGAAAVYVVRHVL